MARTSRKGGAAVQSVTTEKVWHTALYARLSVEDSGRKGADTIETQIELIHSYVSGRDYLDIYDTYIDNGASGADFDRPAWNRMMDDIRTGKVNCIAVKDLSRFGRNYIETCEMLEKIFPFMGVRFISINDGYDSGMDGGYSDTLIISLKNLINDRYLKDISRKICSSVKAQQERGEYRRGFAPFGYIKMDGQKGKLEPDPETAPIIREIFEWRATGMGHQAICARLDERGIPTPTEYLRRKHDTYHSDFFKSTIWRNATLKGILRNPAYIGTLEQGKQSQKLYANKPCADVPRSEWIVFENAHEPIVSRELWDAANAVEKATQIAYAKCGRRQDMPENIFQGFTVCGICGTKISRLYNKKVNPSGKTYEYLHYKCPLHRQHPKDPPYRMLRAEALYDTVFPIVAEKLQSATNLGKIIEERAKRQANPRAILDSEITRVSRELETINQRLTGLYENYIDKLITEREYIDLKNKYSQRAESLCQMTDDLSRRAATVADVSASQNRWLIAAKSFQNPTELTREMLEAIVERIVIFEPERVEVVWKFKDDFDLLEVCAPSEERGM